MFNPDRVPQGYERIPDEDVPNHGVRSPSGADIRPTLEIVSASDFGDGDPPPRDWYVRDLIPAGEVTMLAGDGGTGKSLLALQLAFSGTAETDWIGTLPEPGKVLVVSAEDKKNELHRRLSHIARSKGRCLSEATNLLLLPLAGKDAVLAAPRPDGVLVATPLFHALRAIVKAERPKLLVLDTRSDLFDGDEIKRTHARRFIGLLNGLCVDFDMTVLLLDHPSAEGIRSGSGKAGSTGWSNSVRSRLYLEYPRINDCEQEESDARILTTKKSNYARVGQERILRWRDGVFISNFEAGGAVSLLSNAADDLTFLDCLDVFKRTNQDFSPSLCSTYAPKVFAGSPAAKGLAKDRLAKAMGRLLSLDAIHIVGYGPPSRRRKTLARGSAPIGEAGK